MFISEAFAQAEPAAGGLGGGFAQMAPLILIFVVFYFLLIRPQSKKAKEHRDMVANLRRGDKVVTGGGIVGQISKVGTEGDVTVEIAEGVKIKVIAQTITAVLSKTQPVEEKADKGADETKGK